MSSIIEDGDTYHGISVFGRGVFAHDEYGRIYSGQCKDGYACGLGVLTYFDGSKEYSAGLLTWPTGTGHSRRGRCLGSHGRSGPKVGAIDASV